MAYRWTGKGLTPGTTLTAGNCNTAGNGDTISVASAGTFTAVMTADGVDITGIAGSIFRLQCPFITGLYKVSQVFFTPKELNLGGINAFRIGAGGNSGQATGMTHDNNGRLASFDAVSALITASTTPPILTNGDEYRIDQVLVIGGSITTGRIITLVTDMTNPAWNTTGEFYYDSGYTINTGLVDVTMTYTGKPSGFANPLGMHIREVGWDDLSTVNVSLTPSIARSHFLPLPGQAVLNIVAVTDSTGWTAVNGTTILANLGDANATTGAQSAAAPVGQLLKMTLPGLLTPAANFVTNIEGYTVNGATSNAVTAYIYAGATLMATSDTRSVWLGTTNTAFPLTFLAANIAAITPTQWASGLELRLSVTAA